MDSKRGWTASDAVPHLLDAVADGLELIGKVRAAGVGPGWTKDVWARGVGWVAPPRFEFEDDGAHA